MDEDCPPGAEGYHDSVTEKPKNPLEDPCTKAEHEFQEHLNSLKIKLEDGQTRPMVEKRGRDISGKWIYLCFPCAAMCSGESVLQTHISGKKHKTKLSMRSVWPKSIYEEHPYIMHEKGTPITKGASEKVLQKMAEEVDLHNKPPSELDLKYNKYREVRTHIQDTIDNVKAPLLGLEYLIEHPPEQAHYEPSYICVLCSKQGHPRTIMNHMTCFWHRHNYLVRHFNKACSLMAPFRGQTKFREGLYVIINRLAQRIEDKYGRLKPVNIDKEEYEKDKERIHKWVFKSQHFNEDMGPTFEEVVDVDLINTLHKSNEDSKPANPVNVKSANVKSGNAKPGSRGRDPSPPVVVAPNKPNYRRNDRRRSLDALSDVSDEHSQVRRPQERDDRRKDRFDSRHDSRYKPYDDRRREEESSFRSRYAIRNPPSAADKKTDKKTEKEKTRPPNYEYKLKLADEKRMAFEDSAKKMLAYHEVHPEKHPLYPEEWKKFWNRRYKEIQAEGKDPAKHDFKPEWIVFWRARMKELHEEELRINILELYRKLCLSPPDMNRRSDSKRRSPEPRPAEPRRRSIEPRRRSPEPRRRSPEPRRRSPEPRRRSPEPRRRSPPPRRRSPELRRRSPEPRRLSPERRRTPLDYRREHLRSPEYRHHSPPNKHLRTRSRSPLQRARSPARTHITLDSLRRSRSPLSRRDEASRNRSPAPAAQRGPASHTVMISDDELKPDDNLSPWNSDNDIDSLGSLPDARSPVYQRSHAGSAISRGSRPRHAPYPQSRGADPNDLGPAENVVATLRLLVALEDYLGSLGPKIVDLLQEALKMEKDKPNSSEELLDRESAVVLIETAKEKLKGAMQAGLVPHSASAAVRSAVVRAASTLHEADTRARRQQSQAKPSKPAGGAAVPVAGVGEVDRSQIAQQMAAALIAQGKTDVSSEELAQLVDAVVGMAEAKKREAEVKKKQEARAMAEKASRPQKPAPAVIGTASALQMLQSAYDENDKKVEKEEAPDAMDGLSDSDLETLLKNFNELSAEEQHSLIAYLKKLEAREPQRVERLRQYVSAAATSAPATPAPQATPTKAAAPASAPAPAPPKPAPAPAPEPESEPEPRSDDKTTVTIESDEDDDYTVEEVFQTVNQKVREDQIRQEMEIVKKSLEETKASPAPREVEIASIVDLTNSSSAANLLALVQASIQSASAPKPGAPADVVASAAHPRSFGDLPAPTSVSDTHSAHMPHQPSNHNQAYNRQPINNFGQSNQGSFGGPIQSSFEGSNQANFGDSIQDDFGDSIQDDFGDSNQDFAGSNQDFAGSNQDFAGSNQDFAGSNQDFAGSNQDFAGSNQDFAGSNQDFTGSNQDFTGSNQDFTGSNQGNFGGSNQSEYGDSNQADFEDSSQGDFGGSNQGNFRGSNRGNFGGPNQSNFGGPNQSNFGGPNQGNFGKPSSGSFGGSNEGNFGGRNQGNFGGRNQGSFGGSNQGNFGGQKQGSFGGSNQGNFGGPNQGSFGGSKQGNFGGPNQGSFGGSKQGNFGGPNQGSFGGSNQGNFGNPDQSKFLGQNQGSFGGPNQGNFGRQNQDNFGASNRGNRGSNQGNFGGSNQGGFGGIRNVSTQLKPSPWEKDAPSGNMMDNRGSMRPPLFDNFRQGGGDQFNNQGPRSNFMNGRQDNFNRPPGNNFQGNNNFRGRGGRGNFGGRGRGRGFH